MFDNLMRFLKLPEPPGRPDPRLSVAVLLLEAARQDDNFDTSERKVIETLLTRRFQLTPGECAHLMKAGEARMTYMVGLFGHTNTITGHMTPEDRLGLVEMLWEVAYADGVLDPEEDLLVRRVAKLVYVTDRDRVLARQRVRGRLGQPEP